ncbi:COG4223 family protein [Sulfitobacter alexandrii]|nr:mitofilin family membrane protein [Sulfitobacter alexandrii]
MDNAVPTPSPAKEQATKASAATDTGTTDTTKQASPSSATAAAAKGSAKSTGTKADAPAQTVSAGASSTVGTATNVAASKPAETRKPETEQADPITRDPKSAFQPTRKVIAKTTEATPPPKSPEPVSSPPPATRRTGSIFWPFLLGGAVAAALGFAAAEANFMNLRTETGDMQARLDSQAQDIAALQEAAPPEPDLSGVEQQLAQLSETVQSFETRIAALEDRPAAASGDGSESADDLEEMRAALERQQSEIERLLANAQSIEDATAAAARAAAIQAGVSKMTAAISTGSAYEGVVSDLRDAGVSDLPEPLVEGAAEGVATLSSLQNRFPDAARDALAAARASGQSGEENGGVTAFLRRQLGARSVQPREGSDPDAILSRAEAALRDGRVSDALGEIDSLPDEAQSAMSDWIADARARAGAEAGVEDLSQSLTAN